MGATENVTGPADSRREWLKIFWIIPTLFMGVVCAGIISGGIEVLANDYVSVGLTNIAFNTLTRHINMAAIISLRLLVLTLFFCISYLFFYRNFSRAFRATLGVAVFWVLTLFGLYIALHHGIKGIDTHNLPDMVRKTLSFKGYLTKNFVQKTEFFQIYSMIINKPVVVPAALVLCVPFGAFFERITRRKNPRPAKGKTASKWMLLYWVGFVVSVLILGGANIATFARLKQTGIPQPNIVFISIDTLRSDRLGIYGNEKAKTPTLDMLARDGAVFKNAFSNSPWTLPSHATMLTGLTPTHLGIRKVQDRLAQKVVTLPEILKNYGYKTGAVSSYILVSPAYGFDQGFDRFIYSRDFDAADVVDRGIAYVQRHQLDKFFLFLHIYDPHWPYRPSPKLAKEFYDGPPDSELLNLYQMDDYYQWVKTVLAGPPKYVDFSMAMYDAEISYVDEQLKRLFTEMANLLMINRTLIVVTSDHGEEFNEHGLMGHGLTLYDESLKVPLIVRLPALIPKGTSIDMPVQLVDLTPTVLSLVGIAHPLKYIAGHDLAEEIFTYQGKNDRNILAETAMSGDLRFAITQGPYKYITPFDLTFGEDVKIHHDAEVYDLATDPGENDNLAGQRPTMLEGMKEVLSRELTGIEQTYGEQGDYKGSESKSLSKEELERLRSLGYIQ